MPGIEGFIIKQLKEGDEIAYKYLYDHHYVVLCHIANQYVKDYFVAETMVGDVFFHLWEIRETLQISVSLRSYLIRAVRNQCINYLLSSKERTEISFSNLLSDGDSDMNYILTEEHPLGSLLEQELENEVKKAIQNLPEECRRVFLKSRFEGKKYEEIAQELQISVNTVKYHMKNALSSLHKDLSNYLFAFFYLLLFF